MNITQRGPLGQKQAKLGQNPAYLAAVRCLPCCICEAAGEVQKSPTEAHHVFHDRFGQLKTPDEMAIPLCDGHHQAKFDRTKLAIHNAKEQWRDRYGADYEYTAATQDKIREVQS